MNRNQSPRPVMIEDEPAHEFYANLLGMNPSKNCSPDLQPLPMSAVDSANVIPPDSEKSETPNNSTTPFGKAYRSALVGGKELSKLSLDGSNKGYQMLSKMGWKESEGGLGRKRQGTMVPVKTMLKIDKQGLGKGKALKSRVTHPCPRSKTENTSSIVSRAERRRRAEAEVVANKRARMMINSDLPEEYYSFLGLK